MNAGYDYQAWTPFADRNTVASCCAERVTSATAEPLVDWLQDKVGWNRLIRGTMSTRLVATSVTVSSAAAAKLATPNAETSTAMTVTHFLDNLRVIVSLLPQ